MPPSPFKMTAARAFRIVLASAFGGALIGGAVGLALAVLLPNYYASVFGGPVDAVQTGLGLGVSQGLLGGGVIGLGVVGLLTWGEVRLAEVESRRARDYPRPAA